MRLDLKKFFSGGAEPETVRCTVDLSEVELDGEKPFVSPVEVEAEIRTAAEGVAFLAKTRYVTEQACARCLRTVRREESKAFSHLLVREDEEDLPEDCVAVGGDVLDLDELIYTDVLLSAPAKVLCREDCKGLCPKCGRNLNDGPCGCETGETDPRLAALRELIDETD